MADPHGLPEGGKIHCSVDLVESVCKVLDAKSLGEQVGAKATAAIASVLAAILKAGTKTIQDYYNNNIKGQTDASTIQKNVAQMQLLQSKLQNDQTEENSIVQNNETSVTNENTSAQTSIQYATTANGLADYMKGLLNGSY
jgi:hypothetical protein